MQTMQSHSLDATKCELEVMDDGWPSQVARGERRAIAQRTGLGSCRQGLLSLLFYVYLASFVEIVLLRKDFILQYT